jgi:hypothetical protein
MSSKSKRDAMPDDDPVDTILRRIVATGKTERCLIGTDADGNLVDLISLADVDAVEGTP